MATCLFEPRAITEQPSASLQAAVDHWRARLVLLAVIVVGVGIAWRLVRYLTAYPIWGDEAFLCLNFLDKGFWDLANGLDNYQVAPILFVWIEWLMCQGVGTSELALRFFPVIAGIAAVLLFWRLCRVTLPPLIAALAVSLLAISYYPVRHATEVKPYDFDLFWAVALF